MELRMRQSFRQLLIALTTIVLGPTAAIGSVKNCSDVFANAPKGSRAPTTDPVARQSRSRLSLADRIATVDFDLVFRRMDESYGPWDDANGRPSPTSFIKDAVHHFYRSLKNESKRRGDLSVHASQLVDILKDPDADTGVTQQSSDAVSRKQLAAIFLSHALGVVPKGKEYSLNRLRQEAAFLKVKLTNHGELYRYDRRGPAAIRASNGFHRNPKSLPFTLWEHVLPGVQSGSLVSFTKLEDAPGVRAMVAEVGKTKKVSEKIDFKAMINQIHLKMPNPAAKLPEAIHADAHQSWERPTVKIYQYRASNIIGVETPKEHGIESEAEVVTSSVQVNQISAYREIVVDKHTNEVVEQSEWLTF